MFRVLFVVLMGLMIIGCSRFRETETNGKETTLYASRFQLMNNGLRVLEPWPGASKPIDYTFEKLPERVVVTSTTHLPYLEYLEVLDKLVGFPGLEMVTSERVLALAKQGKIMEIGPGGQLNIESLIQAQPDLVVVFDMGGESLIIDKIEELGIPVLYNSDYLESSPLGRAEWIKAFGQIFGKRKMADSIFTHISNTYDSVKNIANTSSFFPTVMTGVLYDDIWYLPGGRNSFSQLIEDAGGHYLWKENPSNAWIELSFESVVVKAQSADFWIGTSSFLSLDELLSAEDRYVLCKPVFTRNVFNYSKRRSAGGGYDYFESAYVRPDLVLKDLVAILHPEQAKEYEMYYFEKLK